MLDSLRRSFTLIELLLVIGIITIFTAIVYVAISPSRQLGEVRNVQRRSDINTILTVVYAYAEDNKGVLPSTITAVSTPICKSGVNIDCTGMVNLNMLTGGYIDTIPSDPSGGIGTNYWIMLDPLTKKITVSAPAAEGSPRPVLSVTR